MSVPVNSVDFSQFNGGQQRFIDQQTRIHLIRWADGQLIQMAADPDEKSFRLCAQEHQLYWAYAAMKGWVSKKTEMVTSTGFVVAAAMVKKGASVASGC